MSDFIYSSTLKNKGELTKHIHSIYHEDAPEVEEFHGNWGSLAVSRNLYNGFQPLETNSHIFVVIGGPVLCFSDNQFLTESNPVTGTKKVFNRYANGKIKWDEDLSGPFAIISIDKIDRTITCITDLLMFIPIYQYFENNKIVIGTHVNLVAKTSSQEKKLCPVSLAEFLISNVITHPYTSFKTIRTLTPASIQYYKSNGSVLKKKKPVFYWTPKEKNIYKNIEEAAIDLRNGISHYIHSITAKMTKTAIFLSAGEDSRTIAGALPKNIEKDGFIFLDQMNREGKIAKKVANVNGINLYLHYRDELHYLKILPEASDLIGLGYQYNNAHTLRFHKVCLLHQYRAVFGGLSSDTLLKGYYMKPENLKKNIKTIENYLPREIKSDPLENMNSIINQEIIREIYNRRKDHLKFLNEYENKNLDELFVLFPIKQHGIPNLYCNRRLFCSYEPFTCKDVVKMSVSVPPDWKLNRKLFQRSMYPFLKSSKWIPHTEGHLPYFPSYINTAIKPIVNRIWKHKKRRGLERGNQGPWSDWLKKRNNDIIIDATKKYYKNNKITERIFSKKIDDIFDKDYLSNSQKINLTSILYHINKIL